jgi:endonuclease/exonuclease/phosphatase (EEP) superfamily protein YafD
LAAAAWLICGLLVVIVVAHVIQRRMSIDEGPVLAVAYDMMPLTLFAAPVITIASLVTGRHALAAIAGVLTIYHLVLVVPRVISDRIPRWARQAPRFRLAVANVFVDNPTPEAAARQLVNCGAEVLAIAEATPAFMDVFDSLGGKRSHPHRVLDPADTSDYAVTVASSVPLEPGSGMRRIGPLNLAVAKLDIGGVVTTVAVLNPMATVDPGGHETWKAQIEALKAFIPEVEGPLVIAGDLNSTRFRPEFQELLDAGLTDLIDSLGEAWRPSFSLKSVFPLGGAGRVARLDHALGNDGVRALKVRNLKPQGSDHLPFVITLAIRDRGTDPDQVTTRGRSTSANRPAGLRRHAGRDRDRDGHRPDERTPQRGAPDRDQ